MDTDVIIPARYLNSSDPAELATHCMEDIDKDFVHKVNKGDIIVAGKQDFELKRFEVGYFIRSIAAVTVPSLTNAGITLDMRWEPGYIEVEPDLFKTLMINLVDNARKASKRNSTIELYGKAEDGGYAMYVQDHGRGIPQEELIKITEPFYMVDKSRARAQNGAGLGLALCQRIAELHNTKLEYSSELGQGTTVRILLKGGASLAEEEILDRA